MILTDASGATGSADNGVNNQPSSVIAAKGDCLREGRQNSFNCSLLSNHVEVNNFYFMSVCLFCFFYLVL